MPIFNKKNWKDFAAAHPNRRRLTHVNDDLYDVELAVGTIIEEGNKFEADEFNDLEDRISTAFESINSIVEVATTAATNASTYANNANTSATNSSNSALVSEGYALGKQNGIDVTSDSPYFNNNSKYFALMASGSATNAASSANLASSYASNAQASASDAQSYELIAEGFALGKQNGVDVTSDSPYWQNNSKYFASLSSNKASEAAESASSASSSASSASTSASNALNSANSASASAGTATTKASEASASASTATTKANEASTSANTATTKANEANTSAGTAATKASEASASASSASDSADEAEAWADGTINGQPVPSTHPAHDNNAKYWAQQANVTSFTGLSDVSVDTTFAGINLEGMTDGQAMIFDEATHTIVPGDSAGNFSDLHDVDTTGIQFGDNMTYQNSSDGNWKPGHEIRHILDYYGAKNMIPFPYNGTMPYGSSLMYTVNKDGTISTDEFHKQERSKYYLYKEDDPEKALDISKSYFYTGVTGNIHTLTFTTISGGETINHPELYSAKIRIYDGEYPNGTIREYSSDLWDKVDVISYTETTKLLSITLEVSSTPSTDEYPVAKFAIMLLKDGINDTSYTPPTKTNRQLNDYISGVENKTNVLLDDYPKNILPFPYYDQSGKEENGITWTVNSDGSVTPSGTSTDVSRFYFMYNGSPKSYTLYENNAILGLALHDGFYDVFDYLPAGSKVVFNFRRLMRQVNVELTAAQPTAITDSMYKYYFGNAYIEIPSGVSLNPLCKFQVTAFSNRIFGEDFSYSKPGIMSNAELTEKHNVKDMFDTNISNPTPGQVLGFDADGDIVNTNPTPTMDYDDWLELTPQEQAAIPQVALINAPDPSGSRLTILSYGTSTWNDFITAYQNNSIVYCRASSTNGHPESGDKLRMAFMAYVNNETTPTKVEFQYVRTVASKTSGQQSDEVYIYTLENTNGGTWSHAHRNSSPTIQGGDGVSYHFTNGGSPRITLSTPTVAASFSDSTAYAVNDIVYYEGNLYKCIAAHTAGAWDSTHFSQITVASEVASINNAFTIRYVTIPLFYLGAGSNISKIVSAPGIFAIIGVGTRYQTTQTGDTEGNTSSIQGFYPTIDNAFVTLRNNGSYGKNFIIDVYYLAKS